MAAHINYPPDPDAEAVVRGDPETMIMRVRSAGVDQDIRTWTWRSHVRKLFDGALLGECENFDVVTPDELPGLFPAGGTVPCVLLVHWHPDQTKMWSTGNVADIEELTPVKKTWVIFDSIRVDRDVSYSDEIP
jgi:hypothetical protein